MRCSGLVLGRQRDDRDRIDLHALAHVGLDDDGQSRADPVAAERVCAHLEPNAFCASCATAYEADFDRNVELRFDVSPHTYFKRQGSP